MAYNHDKGTCWYNTNTCCYIGIPKTASTTMRRVFSLDDVDNYINPENEELKELDLVTIFRNPLDRIISSYNEVVVRGSHPVEGEGIRNTTFWSIPESRERFIAFLDDTKGNIKGPEVVRSAHKLLDAEAMRVLKYMPKWIPRKKYCKNIAAKVTLPIAFKL